MKLLKPSVRVIDRTDHRLDAWILSRPRTDAHKVEDFHHIDFGLQDLDQVTVEFTGSAGFRELLTNLRPYAMWCQSSRNIGIENIPINEDLEGDYLASARKNYEVATTDSKEIDQDVGRLAMPLAHMMKWYYQAPLRTYIGLWKSLDVVGCEYYKDTYINPIMYHILEKYYDGIGEHVHMSARLEYEMTEGMWKHYKPIHRLFEIDYISWKPESVKSNGIRIVSSEISFALRAQLVRQSQVRVTDNIWMYLKHYGWESYECLRLDAKLQTTTVMTDAAYLAICQKRSCFIAQIELWSDFILEGVKELGYPNVLPCGGCKDKCTLPIEAIDCENRNAVTLPCPVYSGNEWYHKRKDYIGDNELISLIDETKRFGDK